MIIFIMVVIIIHMFCDMKSIALLLVLYVMVIKKFDILNVFFGLYMMLGFMLGKYLQELNNERKTETRRKKILQCT